MTFALEPLQIQYSPQMDMNTLVREMNQRLRYVQTAVELLNRTEGAENSILAYGAQGDGTTDDSAALDAAEAAHDTVFIPDTGSTYVFDRVPDLDISWGSGKVTVGGNRVYLKPYPGPADRIFAKIFDIPVYAGGDGTPALQRAIDYAQLVDLPLEMPPHQLIRADSQITIKQGNTDAAENAAVGHTYRFELRGNGCEIRSRFNGAAMAVVPRATFAAATTSPGIQFGYYRIYDLDFQGADAVALSRTGAYALQIGREGYTMSEERRNVLQGINVSGYLDSVCTENGIKFTNCRMISADELTVLNSAGILIEDTDNDALSFCGDMSFENCWITGNANRKAVLIRGNNTGSGARANVEAVKFDSCFFVTGGVRIYAAENDWHRGIMFNHCSWDVMAADERCIEVVTATDGNIDRIHVKDCDFIGTDGTAIYASGAGSGVLSGIGILGCHFLDIDDGTSDQDAIVLSAVEHATVRDCDFRDVACARSTIYIEDSTGVSVHGCTGMATMANNADFVRLDDDGTCDDWSILGNMASVQGTGLVYNEVSGAATGNGQSANNMATSF